MMLEYLGHKEASETIEKAVSETIAHDETTRDLGGKLSTEQVGAAICQRLKEA
jgi:isocitrate/isopropylmalate dehydrogenase